MDFDKRKSPGAKILRLSYLHKLKFDKTQVGLISGQC